MPHTAKHARRILAPLLRLAARASVPDEYPIEVVSPQHFTQIMEWPAQTADPQTPFVIGVLGDTFASDLDDAMRGKPSNGRPPILKRPAGAVSPIA